IDDPDRWWLGPFEHPNVNWHKKGRYVVARYKRTRAGQPIAKANREIFAEDGSLLGDWHENAEIVSFDPWTELDRAILVDPAWSEREFTDNWGVSCVGQDYDDVKYQLETVSDTSGM